MIFVRRILSWDLGVAQWYDKLFGHRKSIIDIPSFKPHSQIITFVYSCGVSEGMWKAVHAQWFPIVLLIIRQYTYKTMTFLTEYIKQNNHIGNWNLFHINSFHSRFELRSCLLDVFSWFLINFQIRSIVKKIKQMI